MLTTVKSLNEVYSSPSMRRRYEVWFLRLGLADGSGAWWFRYLLMNPGRDGCGEDSSLMPVQVWATRFPRGERPQTFIQGFSIAQLDLSPPGQSPFRFAVSGNAIDENSSRGNLSLDGHNLSWDLHYASTFSTTLSNKGWIGFSRTPHSDAQFSGEIAFDNHKITSENLGVGLQGHNCGYRHRSFWRWTHSHFVSAGRSTTLEALVYDMPLGMVFRKAVLWHEGQRYVFRNLREKPGADFYWEFECIGKNGMTLQVAIDGREPGLHCLPYVNTNCRGTFDVRNNSLAKAAITIQHALGASQKLETDYGAVLEMVG